MCNNTCIKYYIYIYKIKLYIIYIYNTAHTNGHYPANHRANSQVLDMGGGGCVDM